MSQHHPSVRSAAKTAICCECGKEVWKSRTSAAVQTCLPCRRSRPTMTFKPEIRQCKVCASTFETTTSTQVYCTPRCREARRGFRGDARARLSSSRRGYGPEHRKARDQWKTRIARDGGTTCCICGYWIQPDEAWHLDHTPDRTGYRGAAHARCNIRDGAKRGRSKQDEPRSRWSL